MDEWVRAMERQRGNERVAQVRDAKLVKTLVDGYLATLGPEPTYREAKWGVHPTLVGTLINRSTTRRRIDAASRLKPWVEAFGSRGLETLSYEECRDFLGRQLLEGYAPSSVNKSRTYFLSLWRWAYGTTDTCPMKRVPKLKEPPALPRAQNIPLLWAALDGMEASVTRARLKLALATGMRPIEIQQIQPEDLHHHDAQPHLFARTAKDGTPRMVPLNANGVAACEEFVTTQAFGPYSESSARGRFLAALRGQGLSDEQMLEIPAGQGRKRNRWRFQPYVLRHTAATALRAKGADLADVQALMGHKHASTTQRYAPAVSDKLFEAVARTEHR